MSRFTNTPFSVARVDQIATSMGDILRTQDGAADVPCNVSFVRDGAVGTFAVGSGSINSSGDYSEVNALPGNVKVVHRIN